MGSRGGIRLAIGVTCLALAGGAIGACGDDEDEGEDAATETADATEVTVTAVEYDFELSATPTTETQSVSLDNQGEEAHVLIFARINEGYTADEVIELEGEKGSAELIGQTQSKPGDETTVEVKKPLEPGEYLMICPLGSPDGAHYELGQREEFAIE